MDHQTVVMMQLPKTTMITSKERPAYLNICTYILHMIFIYLLKQAKRKHMVTPAVQHIIVFIVQYYFKLLAYFRSLSRTTSRSKLLLELSIRTCKHLYPHGESYDISLSSIHKQSYIKGKFLQTNYHQVYHMLHQKS